MEDRKVADLLEGSERELLKDTALQDCVCVEPNYGDYTEWLNTYNAATPNPKMPNKKVDREAENRLGWAAVNACVRQANGSTKQFLTEDDFRNGKARLHEAVAVAATLFLTQYTLEGREKKAS